MKRAIEVRTGNLLLLEGEIYKVDEIETKGSAKAHKMINLRLRSIPENKYKEMTFNPEDKLEEAELTRKKALYSYKDSTYFYFLDAETFENYPVKKEFLDKKECFLKENQEIDITFHDGNPIEVVFPKRFKLKVTSVDKGIKGSQDSTVYKKARLENGLEINVPHFISENDIVEIDVDTFEYIDRVQEK